MKKKFLSIFFALVLLCSFSLVMAVPVRAEEPIDLAVNDQNPWTDGAFTFENILPGGDPMAFDFKLHNVGDNPGILTFEMSYVENDMDSAPALDMTADEFASLVYVEAVHYLYKCPADGYEGSLQDDIDSWLLMDSIGNNDGKVSLYEICQAGVIPYDEAGDPLVATAEITYFIEFQLGDSLDPLQAGGAIQTGVEDSSLQGDGISVTVSATLVQVGGSLFDTEQSSGNVFQAFGVAGPVLNDTTDVTYDTIQLAIDAASAGDAITVAAGIYNENITIDRTLTLEGAQAGVNARGRTGPESIIDAQLADFGVFIFGETTTATLDGFTVRNYEVGGILAGAFSPPEADPFEVHILNNLVEAPSSLVDAHNNNIQMGDGTIGTIIGNEVSGAHLVDPDWSGSGIIVASTNGVVISNNHAYSCDIGIAIIGYTHGGRTPSEGNIIEYNFVENCGAGIGVQRQSIDTIIRYNDVSNNDVGIESAGYPADVPSGTQIHYNDIVGNLEYGVASIIWGDDPGVPEQVDASKNWWGDPSGPDGAQVFVPGEPGTYTGSLPGTGNKVSAKVQSMPWLTRPFETVLGDDIAYFGVSFPALKGWNIVSVPLALDAHVTAGVYTANTWGGLLNLGKAAVDDQYALKLHYTGSGIDKVFSPIYYYDSDPASPDFGWREATYLTELNPLDAFYIRMKESDSIPILFSPDFSVPSKELYQGWNLVGCAYMDVMFEEGDEQPLVETALATIATVSSPTGDVTGYSQVVSPPLNQEPWIYIPSSGALIPLTAVSTILMGKGYWVFMENPGTLAGLTFTPISLPK